MFINDNKSKKDDDGEEEEEEEDSDEADGPGVRAARQRIVVQDMESMDNDNSRTLNNSHRWGGKLGKKFFKFLAGKLGDLIRVFMNP